MKKYGWKIFLNRNSEIFYEKYPKKFFNFFPIARIYFMLVDQLLFKNGHPSKKFCDFIMRRFFLASQKLYLLVSKLMKFKEILTGIKNGFKIYFTFSTNSQ